MYSMFFRIQVFQGPGPGFRSSRLFEEDVSINVSQHSQENTCARVSFLINIATGLQVKPIFIQKEVPALVFS